MNEQAIGAPRPRRAPQRRSDGQDGPLIQPPPGAVLTGANSTGPNAALKETPKAGDGVDPAHKCRGRTQILDADQGLVVETAPDGTLRRKIAVCGFASSTRKYMPVDDQSWSIWGLNQLYRHVPRADRWFDIHHNWDKEVVPGTDYEGWLKACGMPVYMLARQPQLPTSVRFPIDALIAYFKADYFTSTIAYMVALAVWEIDAMVRAEMQAWVRRVPKRQMATFDLLAVLRGCYERYAIGIFGVDLVVGEEYFWQKPCAEFWCGEASARGIQLVLPPECALCKQAYRYGYDPEPNQLIKLGEVTAQQASVIKQRDEMLKKLWMAEGVIETFEQMKQVLTLRSRGASVTGD